MALHSSAASVISQVLSKKGSLKACVYQSEWRSKTVLYAVVTETLKFKDVLEELIDASRIREKESKILSKLETPWLLHVLLYELILGRNKTLKGKTVFEKALLKHKTFLAAEWVRLKVKKKAKCDADMALRPGANDVTPSSDAIVGDPSEAGGNEFNSLPRYVRVNTLKVTMAEVVDFYAERGFTFVETPSTNEAFTSLVSKLESRSFLKDIHMGDFLLVFPSGTSFHDCPLYKNGTLILQDKASCLPPFVLQPTSGSRVIDACAAPGNKTTLLAAMMGNEGLVTAFDISAKRAKLMKQMTLKAGALKTGDGDGGCVEIRNEDFLALNPNDESCRETLFIVVDPSCSGSGIQTRLNHLTDDSSSASPQRLLQLQDFQVRALTHALSFPRVKRVVYSTCSIHAEENEVVVIKALEKSRAEGWGFRLKEALPTNVWTTRGGVEKLSEGGDCEGNAGGTSTLSVRTSPSVAENFGGHASIDHDSVDLGRCLRASPQTDMTNGFFVALFERNDEDCRTGGEVYSDEEDEDLVVVAASSKRRLKKEKKKRKKLKNSVF